MCVCDVGRFQSDSALCPLFPPKLLPLSHSLTLSVSLPLSLSLEDPSATGASEAQERSLGKEEQRAVHLQPSPLCTSSAPSPPVLPSLGPLAHWPVPQIKTSDKKMGSLKKGGREKKRERKKEVHYKPREAERQSLCCWMAGPLCCSVRNCHRVNLDPLLSGTQTIMKTHAHTTCT